MYIKLTNGNPETYTIDQLRSDNPSISFPKTISNEILSRFDVFPYTHESQPSIDEKSQKIEDGNFIQDEYGNWIKTWNILIKTQEEIESWILSKEMEVRNLRNMLLAETDYLALSDNTLTPEMSVYRQSLRDITKQSGFPENVIWPVKPV